MSSYKKMNIQKRTRKTVLLAVVAALLALCVAIWVGYSYYPSSQPDSATKNGVNYSPANETDKELNDSVKQSVDSGPSTDEAPSKTNSSQTKSSVKPVITAYGQPGGDGNDFKLNSYVPDVIESDGSCTLTLTRNGKSATASKGSLQNAQNTSCGQLIIPFSQLSPGDWSAVLRYDSPASSGSSDSLTVSIN